MIKAIAFDLDDTLIDTTHLLVPAASRSAYEAMTSAGLQCSFETFERERKAGALSMKHEMIFQLLAQKYAPAEKWQTSAQAGSLAFYNPVIPSHLPLLPGARENLENLSKRYALFLVTSGHPDTQTKKAEASQTRGFFQKFFMIDGRNKQRKSLAFKEIISSLNLSPANLLSVGNRLSQEIHDAKELGSQTCYFKFGEHVGEQPRNEFEIPDFVIEKHEDLISTCRL